MEKVIRYYILANDMAEFNRIKHTLPVRASVEGVDTIRQLRGLKGEIVIIGRDYPIDKWQGRTHKELIEASTRNLVMREI